VTEEGPAVASFPEKNAMNYSNDADHFMLISRPSGRDFSPTETFLDIEPVKDFFRRYSIVDDAEKTRFSYGGA